MELIGRFEGKPFRDDKGNNMITVNFGADDKAFQRMYDSYHDKNLLVDLKIFKKKRSNEANRYFWKCIYILAAGLQNDNWDQYLMELERYGRFVSMEVLKDAYPDLQNIWRETKITGEKTGSDGQEYYIVNCYFGSSTYKSDEFARLLDGVLQDIKDAGLEVPVYKGKDKNMVKNNE